MKKIGVTTVSSNNDTTVVSEVLVTVRFTRFVEVEIKVNGTEVVTDAVTVSVFFLKQVVVVIEVSVTGRVLTTRLDTVAVLIMVSVSGFVIVSVFLLSRRVNVLVTVAVL